MIKGIPQTSPSKKAQNDSEVSIPTVLVDHFKILLGLLDVRDSRRLDRMLLLVVKMASRRASFVWKWRPFLETSLASHPHRLSIGFRSGEQISDVVFVEEVFCSTSVVNGSILLLKDPFLPTPVKKKRLHLR